MCRRMNLELVGELSSVQVGYPIDGSFFCLIISCRVNFLFLLYLITSKVTSNV